MKVPSIISVLFWVVFSSCQQNENHFIFESERFENLNDLKLSDVIIFEKERKSVERTYDNTFGLGKDYYPNERNFKLANPKVFEINESNLQLETDYFFTNNDSLVKVILYQWNAKNYSKLSFDTLYVEYDKPSNKKIFYEKFQSLKSDLVKRLGKESKNLDLDFSSAKYEHNWKTDNLSVHLALHDDNNSFRQIRLIIYGK